MEAAPCILIPVPVAAFFVPQELSLPGYSPGVWAEELHPERGRSRDILPLALDCFAQRQVDFAVVFLTSNSVTSIPTVCLEPNDSSISLVDTIARRIRATGSVTIEDAMSLARSHTLVSPKVADIVGKVLVHLDVLLFLVQRWAWGSVQQILVERVPGLDWFQKGRQFSEQHNCLPSRSSVRLLYSACRTERERQIMSSAASLFAGPFTLLNMFGIGTSTFHLMELLRQSDATAELISDELSHCGRGANANGAIPTDEQYPELVQLVSEHLEKCGLLSDSRLSNDQLHRADMRFTYEKLQEAVQEGLGQRVSVSTLRRLMLPPDSRRVSAGSYKCLLPVRWKLPTKDGGRMSIDIHFCRADVKLIRAWIARVDGVHLCFDDKAMLGTGDSAVIRQCAITQNVLMPVSISTSDFASTRERSLQLTSFLFVRPKTTRSARLTGLAESGRTNNMPSINGGRASVTVRKYIDLPSSAAQHLRDLLAVIESNRNEVLLPARNGSLCSALFLQTDGGADVNPRFDGMRIACAMIFLALDLDVLCHAATAGYDSKMNRAERVNATLTKLFSGVQLPQDATLENAMEEASLRIGQGTFSEEPITVVPVRSSNAPFFSPANSLDQFCSAPNATRHRDLGHLSMQPAERLNGLRLALGLPATLPSPLPTFREIEEQQTHHCFRTHYSTTWMRCVEQECSFCGGLTSWRGSQPPPKRKEGARTPIRPQPLPDANARWTHYLDPEARLLQWARASTLYDGADDRLPSGLIHAFVEELDLEQFQDIEEHVMTDAQQREKLECVARDCCIDINSTEGGRVLEYAQHCLEKRVRMKHKQN